MLTNVHN
jgi:hypothetical protein